ncbi:MAG TPA: hypothetical protein VM689_09435 [Aliidongia sp.]|nr:hypothetical protein [Aliidongia sp.]
MWHRSCLAASLYLMLGGAALAQPAPPDADWPCRQRLVPELTAGGLWNGPPPPADRKWQDDKRIAGLVTSVSSRDLPVDEGKAQLNKFADGVKPAERKVILPEIFAGIVDEVNRQRGEVIARLREMTRRQRDIGDVVAKVTTELQQIPETAEGADAQRRAEIVQRRNYVIRAFEETEHTMRYACEVPVALEARLGDYARLLQGKLGG